MKTHDHFLLSNTVVTTVCVAGVSPATLPIEGETPSTHAGQRHCVTLNLAPAFTRSSLLKLNHNRGFTLVEMVLVLGIIALLVGAGIVSLIGVLDTGKATRVKGDLNTLSAALRAYETENMFLPTTEQGVNALVERPSSNPAPPNWRPFLKKLILDPWGNPYKYRRPGVKDKGGYDLYSSGPDGQDGSADDIGNWQL